MLRALNFWCARAPRGFLFINYTYIVTFVQVKLLVLFANIHTPSLYLSLSWDINKHTIQLFFLVRNKTKQSREISRHPLMERTCNASAVDLMELILIWCTDWKEVNQLISHNNIAYARRTCIKSAHTHNIQKVTGAAFILGMRCMRSWRSVLLNEFIIYGPAQRAQPCRFPIYIDLHRAHFYHSRNVQVSLSVHSHSLTQ